MALRIAKALMIIAGLTFTLSACGVRGPVEAPPETQSSQTTDGEPAPEAEEPHRGFILDRLL